VTEQEQVVIASGTDEVSGWDCEGQFFMEYAETQDAGKSRVRLILQHRVPLGELLFVRCLRLGQPKDPQAIRVNRAELNGIQWEYEGENAHPQKKAADGNEVASNSSVEPVSRTKEECSERSEPEEVLHEA
jgi:hypothetical protein